MLGFAPLAGAALASSGDANTRTLILAATDAQDVAVFHVDGSPALYLLATEAPDVVDILTAGITISYLTATDSPDTAAIIVENINLNLSAVEAEDIASFAVAISGSLVIAATEAPDTYSQNAYILWLTPDQPDDPSIWVPKNDPAPYLTTVI